MCKTAKKKMIICDSHMRTYSIKNYIRIICRLNTFRLIGWFFFFFFNFLFKETEIDFYFYFLVKKEKKKNQLLKLRLRRIEE
jgi:hypothetical protein